MSDYLFSFGNYEKMCIHILETHALCDYKDVLERDPQRFIILRHDVEFSPERALALGQLEYRMGIASSYFFQVTNNAYNTLSARNLAYINELLDMGHHIGLHFHLNAMTDMGEIESQIQYEADLLSHYLKREIDRFSFHRPTPQVLKANLNVGGLINAYAPEFFTFYDAGEIAPQVHVKYIADSKNAWQYTAPFEYPSSAFFKECPKVQILCHPYSWTPAGHSTLNNLKSLIQEKRAEFISTMDLETKYVRGYLDEL